MKPFIENEGTVLSIENADMLVATEFTSVGQFKETFANLCLVWPSWIDAWNAAPAEDILDEIADELGALLPKGYDWSCVEFEKLDWVGNDQYTEWWFVRPKDEDWAELRGRKRKILDIETIVETDDCYDWSLNPDRTPCRVWRLNPKTETITLSLEQLKLILEM
jgi:hypothetical protein